MGDHKNKIHFYQGGEVINGEGIKSFKHKLFELIKVKNVSFLLGAGASFPAIPSMKAMYTAIKGEIESTNEKELRELFLATSKEDNLETQLGLLYARKHYLKGVVDEDNLAIVDKLIKQIKNNIFSKINIDLSSDEASSTLELYKKFYQKITLRNKDLSRVNIFTSNYDLLNERALDGLSINYNNGFGGGLDRAFNPARFDYTFSRKIDANLEKFEPLENMVYLYKLHGSINWFEEKRDSLFDIHEIPIQQRVEPSLEVEHVLIYPTPLKQNLSLSSPYSDLLREFKVKLSQANSALFIIGYSFSDEHINNIIYQSLASNSSISIVIFGEHEDCPLVKIKDSRIYRIFSTHGSDGKIHYFKYIVDKLLPNLDENKEKTLLKQFISALEKERKKNGE